MNGPYIRSVWTAQDERNLNELQERRSRVMAEHRSRVMGVLSNDDPGAFGITDEQSELLVNWLIDNAEPLRDALEPFDSLQRAERL